MNTNTSLSVEDDVLRDKINEVLELWMKEHPEVLKWWKRISVGWNEVVDFLLKAGDYFIKVIDDMSDDGKGKKIVVMKAISEVYDKIVPPLMPIWIRPLNTPIKAFIFNVIINNFIDYFVLKYRENEWNKKEVKFM